MKTPLTRPIDTETNTVLYEKQKRKGEEAYRTLPNGFGVKHKTSIEESAGDESTTCGHHTAKNQFTFPAQDSLSLVEETPTAVHAKTISSDNFNTAHLLNRGCPKLLNMVNKDFLTKGTLNMERKVRHEKKVNLNLS